MNIGNVSIHTPLVHNQSSMRATISRIIIFTRQGNTLGYVTSREIEEIGEVSGKVGWSHQKKSVDGDMFRESPHKNIKII